jgi:hypothetical protein
MAAIVCRGSKSRLQPSQYTRVSRLSSPHGRGNTSSDSLASTGGRIQCIANAGALLPWLLSLQGNVPCYRTELESKGSSGTPHSSEGQGRGGWWIFGAFDQDLIGYLGAWSRTPRSPPSFTQVAGNWCRYVIRAVAPVIGTLLLRVSIYARCGGTAL